MRAIDETGNTYHRLTVLGRADNESGQRSRWLCQCECGNTHITRGENLRNGRTKSCGCLQKDLMSERMRKHGYEYGSEEYKNHQNDLRLQRKYGITTEQRDEMIEAQDNKCLICNTDFDEIDHAPHVDHCHESGIVRGILCKFCNTGLGQFKDNTDFLKSAIEYLEKH